MPRLPGVGQGHHTAFRRVAGRIGSVVVILVCGGVDNINAAFPEVQKYIYNHRESEISLRN